MTNYAKETTRLIVHLLQSQWEQLAWSLDFDLRTAPLLLLLHIEAYWDVSANFEQT
jgi:hypothetical protein